MDKFPGAIQDRFRKLIFKNSLRSGKCSSGFVLPEIERDDIQFVLPLFSQKFSDSLLGFPSPLPIGITQEVLLKKDPGLPEDRHIPIVGDVPFERKETKMDLFQLSYFGKGLVKQCFFSKRATGIR